MNVATQKACVWCGIAFTVLFFLGFWVVAGFVPPPSPNDSPEEIASLFKEDTSRIRIGLIVCMVAATLLAPWAAAVSVQMRRMEGSQSVLAYAQLAVGAILVLEFLYLFFFWQTAAFRPSRAAETLRLLNDMAWLPMIGMVSTGVLQAVLIGVAVLQDKQAQPIFPRWAGYLNIWAALAFVPGAFTVFVKSGPLAWNGILAWYIPLGSFGVWFTVNSVLMLRAINRKHDEDKASVEPSASASTAHLTMESLAQELSDVRRQLAQVLGAVAGAPGGHMTPNNTQAAESQR